MKCYRFEYDVSVQRRGQVVYANATDIFQALDQWAKWYAPDFDAVDPNHCIKKVEEVGEAIDNTDTTAPGKEVVS